GQRRRARDGPRKRTEARHNTRPGEPPRGGRGRGSAPRERRAEAHEEEERQRDRNLDAVEVRAADRELRARDRLGDEGVQRPQEHRERRGHEEDVLEEEDRLARKRRPDRPRVAEPRGPPEEKADGGDEDRAEMAEEDRSDRGEAERVAAVHEAASTED